MTLIKKKIEREEFKRSGRDIAIGLHLKAGRFFIKTEQLITNDAGLIFNGNIERMKCGEESPSPDASRVVLRNVCKRLQQQ